MERRDRASRGQRPRLPPITSMWTVPGAPNSVVPSRGVRDQGRWREKSPSDQEKIDSGESAQSRGDARCDTEGEKNAENEKLDCDDELTERNSYRWLSGRVDIARDDGYTSMLGFAIPATTPKPIRLTVGPTSTLGDRKSLCSNSPIDGTNASIPRSGALRLAVKSLQRLNQISVCSYRRRANSRYV